MRAWGVVPGTRRVQVVTRPEPGPPGPGEVLLEVLACGVCGTDRHLVAMDRVRPEPGQEDLVLGHEPLARVLAVGPGVAHLREGDLVSATNQRSCGRCDACLAGEVDFCATGAGLGRGVGGLDGFLRPRLVDDAAHVVPIPSELGEVGVLTEPLAVGEKLLEAMRHAGARQRHRPWGRTDEAWAEGLRVLVGGAGPIGLLVALALRCHGAEVHVLDRVPPASRKAAVVRGMGARYHQVGPAELEDLEGRLGPVDAAVEAAGSGELARALWRALGQGGILGVLGGAHGGAALAPEEVFGRALGRNLTLVGSVASNPRHFRLAVADLVRAEHRFPGTLAAMVTRRYAFDEGAQAFEPVGEDDVKRVITLAGA